MRPPPNSTSTFARPGGPGRQSQAAVRPATDYPVATTSQAEFVTCMVVVAVGLCVAVVGAIAVAHFAKPPLQAPAAAVAGSAVPDRPFVLSPDRPAGGGGTVPLAVYIQAIDRIWWQESRRGTDPKAARGVVGPHGELGPMQVTPIWRKDVERLTGILADPYDMGLLRYHTIVWLMHYSSGARAVTVDDMADMHRLGPTGFRDRAAEKETP